MEAKVSVVVPVYNAEKYIKTCVNSIRNQTYKNLEIILVDDGAKDNSPQICDDFQKEDARIRVIHKKNEGAGKSRNRGIEIATGDYILFVDSDDYIKSTLIEKCVKAADGCKAAIVMFGVENVWCNGSVCHCICEAGKDKCIKCRFIFKPNEWLDTCRNCSGSDSTSHTALLCN